MESLESAHFVYLYAPGDGVDTVFQERHYAWAVDRLAVIPTAKLVYHKYRDRAHLERLTGRRANGFAEPGTYRFHTIWPADNHEYIHSLFTTLVGDSPALFNEGLAVAHHGASVDDELDGQPLWNGSSVHVLARGFKVAGTLPGLDELITSRGFRRFDDQITYPVAGSFVRFLIDGAGVDAFKRFASRGDPHADATEIEADFVAVYDETLASWWDRWSRSLDALGAGDAGRSSGDRAFATLTSPVPTPVR